MGAQNGSHVTLLGTLGHPLGTLRAPLALLRAQHTIFASKFLPNPPQIVPKRTQNAQVTATCDPKWLTLGMISWICASNGGGLPLSFIYIYIYEFLYEIALLVHLA